MTNQTLSGDTQAFWCAFHSQCPVVSQGGDRQILLNQAVTPNPCSLLIFLALLTLLVLFVLFVFLILLVFLVFFVLLLLAFL